MLNPFIPDKRYKHIVTEIIPRDKVVVKFHTRKDVLVEHDDDDPGNFLTKEIAVVEQEIPLNEYIEQFARDTDLKEKIARLRNKEEYDAFIGQVGLPANSATYIQQDYLSDIEMEAIISRGSKAWDELDPDLKKDLTKEEFLKQFNEKQFASYIDGLKAKEEAAAASKQKEGEE